ncbi:MULTISPECIES: 2-oxoglutarate dehydrogenase, E2 component, dihydrolipoamide succinyltransferase [unclassified Brevibacterium]|uniref:2-oxoglutarate dehydrogenase, E2 component, dihydrolipoamide succinyltransferase n=1 Tax=unclassified Brevibacterium TaxID=2614124 RepID=UPI001091B7F8|nr:2-oxoglutarate dehydrogenase, E2 component, dihydrolipoamide succinyltransferase [Brevibacterium sp. S22]TGD32219.1 2-oxoglutarate dehydrogenase, E2 component, dihydrolipoamide succinyltransferase [Brevibacterium sp. S22]
MSNSVQMPALGESVTEGTVTRWLKEVGEEVEVDEPLLEVSTDKVDTEIPSPYAGTLEKVLAEEDDVVEVGGDLAYIGDGSGASSDDEAPASEEAAEEPAEAPTEEAPAEEAAPAAEEAPAEESAPAAADSGSSEGTEITMPALGESVTEGTVTRWLKEVGEEVEVDEPLLEVSTDKVDTEVPSPVAGVVQAHLAEEDDTVEVGAPLARIGSGAPAESAPAESASAEEAPQEEAPAEEAPQEEAPAEEAPQEEAPAEEAPKQEAPKQEAPAQEAPKQESAPQPASAQAAASAQAEEPVEAASQAPAAADTVGENAAYVTPLVRRLAREKGVDLSKVSGTGVGGRIRKQDVETAAKNGPAAAPAAQSAAPAGAPKAPFKVEIPEEVAKLRGTTEKASRIRQTIAKRMSESLEVSAQLTQVVEVDMSRIVKLRKANKEAFQAKHGSKLTYLPFFAKSIVEALQVHPKVNAQYDLESQQITYFDHEHLAVAVDTPRGLLVPVIKDAGGLSVAGLSKAIDDVADRTRNNKIMPDELAGGTFTVTNIGSVGALFDTPIINQPQMGILGTGAIVRRPIAVKTADGEEAIAIRDMVYLPLTYNHQLVDGADAGRFLQTIKARLEEGNFEADLDL